MFARYFWILVTERRLDEALSGKHFDLIKENVTPKILTNCKTNALLKAFEVRCVF